MGTTLGLRSVGDLSGTFFVPAYQRGYRWGEQEVKQLLDDIWENTAEVYCLQPVVVKSRGANAWELVDGQQRLTTLYLLLRHMQSKGLQKDQPLYSLHYETRPKSAEYLDDPTDSAAAQANIDFFHIHRAYETIAAWFKKHPEHELVSERLKPVKVIWYEAPEDVDATALFTRLNVGRIPLTDAELLKALLLRANVKDRLRLEEVAAQWDAIEHSLHNEDFWVFVTNAKADQYPARIELLFALLAGVDPTARRPRYYTFDKLQERVERDRTTFWSEVLGLYALLREWYEDRDLYHKVGYLIADGTGLDTLLNAAHGETRSAFRASLDARIQKSLSLTPNELKELSYDENYTACLRVLHLTNVEAVRTLHNDAERYSFRAHKSARWSLEHIHAQHAEGLTKKEQWEAWLRMHRDALGALPMDAATRAALQQRITDALPEITREVFDPLSREIAAHFHRGDGHQDDDLHGLANLALLDAGNNSALNNAVFEVKRRRILALDKAGAYIPLCTRRVFLKYFTDADAQQVHFWSPQDRTAWLDAIAATLQPYLTPETTP